MAREYVSSPVEQPGLHTRTGVAFRPVVEQLGDRFFLQEVEQPRIAEEVGHSDEKFLVEQLDFLWVLLEETNVPRQAVKLVDAHAAFDPAADRALLVAGEVVAGVGTQKNKDLFERGSRFPLSRTMLLAGCRGVREILDQLGGKLLRRRDVIRHARVDRAAGHAVILGRGGVLHHYHPEGLLDGPQTQRAVAPHARENDPDGFFLLVRGQMPEEEVDRHPLAPGRDRFEHLEFAVQDGQVRIRGNHVDAIRLDLHPIFHLDDRHLGVPPKQFRHHAFVGRLKVRHQDERQPGIRGQVGEELLECLQTAGRRSHADDVRDDSTGEVWSRCFR